MGPFRTSICTWANDALHSMHEQTGMTKVDLLEAAIHRFYEDWENILARWMATRLERAYWDMRKVTVFHTILCEPHDLLREIKKHSALSLARLIEVAIDNLRSHALLPRVINGHLAVQALGASAVEEPSASSS